MNDVFIGLLTEAIGFGRDILRYATAREQSLLQQRHEVHIAEQQARHEQQIASQKQQQDRQLAIARENDKKQIQAMIESSNRHFEELLQVQTNLIIRESYKQHFKETIQELQAQVNSLKNLINTNELDPNLVMQLVVNSLNPLQVKLEVAKLRLREYEATNAWEYCYIIGTSALISGYDFLGQDVTHMKEELSLVMKNLQRKILNETAIKLISLNEEIPWEDVPKLLSPEGAEDLGALYTSISEKISPFDVSNMTINELKQEIEHIESLHIIDRIIVDEKSNRHRSGALKVIEARRNSLL